MLGTSLVRPANISAQSPERANYQVDDISFDLLSTGWSRTDHPPTPPFAQTTTTFARNLGEHRSQTLGVYPVTFPPSLQGRSQQEHASAIFQYERLKPRPGGRWEGFIEGERSVAGRRFPTMSFRTIYPQYQVVADGLFVLYFPDDYDVRRKFFVFMWIDLHPDDQPGTGLEVLDAALSSVRVYAQAAGKDIFSFYQTALAVAQATHERDLSIICQKPLPDQIFTKQGDMFVTFLAGSTKKIVLAVFSKQSLSSRSSIIRLDRNQPGVEWMFVFDRDRDGKIDYILWPVGAFPYLEGPPPPGFPVRTGSSTAMSREQATLLQRYARMIFFHWADENFEGKLSAVILDAWDPGGLFAVTGWQVIRSSHFDGVLDQCWYFKQNIADKTAECERADQGYKTRSFNAMVITPGTLMETSFWLSRLNEAGELCTLTGDSF